MPSEPLSHVKFEIGHVLFIDIVGYSKLLITEQSDRLQKLKQIVRGTEQFGLAEAEGKLLRLPTGDGGALVFRNSPEAPVLCALEISKALKSHPELHVRMGIHSGPVNEVIDLNEQANIAGAGINIAQRVMDCGDAGHILLSKHVADDLEQYPQWRSHLHELGECEVKHGVRVHAVNLYTDEVGNPEVPERFKTVGTAAATGPPKSVIPKWTLIGAAVLTLIAAAFGSFLFWQRWKPKTSAPTSVIQEKSIAVLPLVNTSGDPRNDYFSDGLSEELIAVLAKIPGLKIIGRSSSFLFKGKSGDSRTIGEKLGVANLLEGSVRKQGDRVRIVAELINAADGRALWSETYDRELKDVFAVQSEIATAVTEQLKIKLLGAPAKSDAAPSNDNLAAYNALQQGTFYVRLSTEEGTRKATEFYSEAIRLDPNYALAHANLSLAWRQLGAAWLGGGVEANEVYAKARNEAQVALSLAPNLSTAHEALGFVLLTPDLDFAGAEAELRKAEKLAPADAGPKGALCILLGAQGRLAEAENVARQTLALDPLGVTRYLNLARILIGGGRYDEAEAVLRNAVALQPAAARLHAHLTTIDVLRGNATGALQDAQLEPSGFWRDYALALAHQTQSDRAAADAALQKLINEDAVGGPFQIAAVYGLRNESDKMFEWLERAYTERDPGLAQLLVTPFILTYKNDPRFAAFCQKLKVPVPTTVVTKP